MRFVWRGMLVVLALVVLAVAVYAGNISVGMHVSSQNAGTLQAAGLHHSVSIVRDARDIPHIRAQDEHDAFFAQGYAQGSDRLFQLDLLRRFVYGRLSEVLGSATVNADISARTVPVAQLVDAQYAKLSQPERDDLQAFSDGINAAMNAQPVPVEFRVLLYSPEPWSPKDSLAVGFATVMDLTDTWDDIAGRTGQEPLTDACYDAPVLAGLQNVRASHCAINAVAALDTRNPIGSNNWASGAAHTTTGRALLANDPHLRLQIPGIWYLNDLQAPRFHVAGATLVGTPGVTLGHNEHLAWGATNGTVAALSVFEAGRLNPAKFVTEHIAVRFGGERTARFYRDGNIFGANVTKGERQRLVLVRWDTYAHPVSPLTAFYGLDHADSIEAAVAALRTYPGPTQNFVLADTTGRAAYYLAGHIPNDPLWARAIHPAKDLRASYPVIAFDALPHVSASRNAIVWTANNKMYGAGYPYRLGASFTPPYRAYRITEMLRARTRYDVAYFAQMQNDVISIPERELARRLLADPQLAGDVRDELRTWDGSFAPDSQAASVAFNVRRQLQAKTPLMADVMFNARAHVPHVTPAPESVGVPWSSYGGITVKHPLAALGASFLNGSHFAGNGDAFTVHVQNTGFSQSFRAVWDVGNWDNGGIIIPQGESGQPGSPFYTDQSQDWTSGKLIALPFSAAAVQRDAHATLTLNP